MLILYRYHQTAKLTLGLLLLDNKFLADTLELPWKDNAKFTSCIPEGKYKINWELESNQWPCYRFEKVPGRENILIHPANTISDLEGCIAFGEKWGDAVWHSSKTLNKVHELVEDSIDILITSVFGGP